MGIAVPEIDRSARKRLDSALHRPGGTTRDDALGFADLVAPPLPLCLRVHRRSRPELLAMPAGSGGGSIPAESAEIGCA